MTGEKLGVGIIGVTPGQSWAALGHIPALQALEDYEIVAISTTRAESAMAAAQEYGIGRWYDNHCDLAEDPSVDIVVVSVKVPHHLELVKSAIAASKHVYCEWPLGNGLREAEEMARLARNAGIKAVVGLQARAAPAINYVRDLVAGGYVGEVLSTTLVGSGVNWGNVIDQAHAYNADRSNGATMLTIPFGHAVDALRYCLGDFVEIQVLTAVRRSRFTLLETGETRPMTSEDQVVAAGVLEIGAVAAIHYRGGMSRGTNLLWEINGTEGDLRVTADAGHVQLFDLTLEGARGDQRTLEPLTVPEKYQSAPEAATGFAANLAAAYRNLAADIREGTKTCPSFDDAVAMHRLLAAVEEGAESSRRVILR